MESECTVRFIFCQFVFLSLAIANRMFFVSCDLRFVCFPFWLIDFCLLVFLVFGKQPLSFGLVWVSSVFRSIVVCCFRWEVFSLGILLHRVNFFLLLFDVLLFDCCLFALFFMTHTSRWINYYFSRPSVSSRSVMVEKSVCITCLVFVQPWQKIWFYVQLSLSCPCKIVTNEDDDFRDFFCGRYRL